MKRKPEIKSTTAIAQSRLFGIEAVDLVFENGKSATFERIVTSGAAVMVVPIIDGGVLMVREYAAGTDRYELGFVKGRIDTGETPEQAAQRELKEEIGFGAHDLNYVQEMHAIPHYSNFKMHLFFATDLYPEQLVGDELEPLEQFRWKLDEIDTLLNHSEVNDPRVIMSLLRVERWLNR